MKKSELTFYVVILSILCIWQTILLVKEIINIKKGPEDFGDSVYVIKRTPKWLIGSGTLIGLYIIYLAKSLFAKLPFVMLFICFVIYVEGVIYTCLKSFRPIIIYEKGIWYPRDGMILWEHINSVEIDRSNRNRILLKRKEFQCDYLKIDCMPGITTAIFDYIQFRINE